MKRKSYRELSKIKSFDERYEYLKLDSKVGDVTFGFERGLNRRLYQSREWKQVRNKVLLRDAGCDLGDDDREIFHGAVIHHINPISIEDIENGAKCVFDPDNLITVSHKTHNAIHFGDASLIPRLPPERKRGDTTPWKTVS